MKGFIFLIFFPFCSLAQNTIGLPDIINYPKQSYSAGLQNWDIKQDANGIMYFANNEGLLSFDGREWRLYPLPNKTIVRSVEIAADNRIYVGGQNELGYFAPAKNGQLQYHSLTGLLPAKYKTFGDVWDIVSSGKDIYFRLASKIFRITGSRITTYETTSGWSFLGACNGRIYAQDYRKGLMRLENNHWVMLADVDHAFPSGDPVTAIVGIKGAVWVTTLKNGVFIVTPKGLVKQRSPNTRLFENSRIYAAAPVNNEWVALGTVTNGVSIVDSLGRIIQSFSRTEGLQNNHVRSIFLDNQANLWLGLDNGIDFIAYNSAIKHINPFLLDLAGYTAIIYRNRLYSGTSNGLYSVPLQNMQDLSFSKGVFSFVANTEGQTWGLKMIGDKLLLGHHEGAYEVRENTGIQLSGGTGFWNFTPTGNQQIVAGNYRGLAFFNNRNGKITFSGEMPGFTETSRFVVIDSNGDTWVAHPYHGLFRISRDNKGGYTTQIYGDKNGLPSALNNYVYKIRGEMLAATIKGIYRYNYQTDRFEPLDYYRRLLGDQSIRYLKEDPSGNTWFVREKTMGVIDVSGPQPRVIYLPELNNKLLSGFEFIYPVNEYNTFICGEKGLFHINYRKYKKNVPRPKAQIRSVHIFDNTDSILFGGYFKGVNEKQVQEASQVPDVANHWKTIRFEFSSSLFEYQNNLEYSYRLSGYERSWSEWSKRTDKEYTNLPPGRYAFEVKIKNNLHSVSEPVAYTFVVLPPWYLTVWAKIIYFLVFLLGLYLLYRWLSHQFELQRLKHEDEQNRLRYIHELERNKAENELITLGNEKLQAEISFKNSELASSAMHLVKKGELIAKIKSMLAHVMKELDSPQVTTEMKKVIRALNEDDNLDKEWENFSKHFDKIQGDFLNELKERHPTVTSNELKLSAYLRMNLSTKEIAQLANISVRGVEIGRYRLRKKLQLPAEITLFDYLISLNQDGGGK